MFSYKGDVGLAGAGGLGSLQSFHQSREATKRQQLIQAARASAALRLQSCWRRFQAQRSLASAVALIAFGSSPGLLLNKLFLLECVPASLRWRASHTKVERARSVNESLIWKPSDRERISWLLSGRIRSAADLKARYVLSSPDYLEWRASAAKDINTFGNTLLPPVWRCAAARAIEHSDRSPTNDILSRIRSLSLIARSFTSWQCITDECSCDCEFPSEHLLSLLRVCLQQCLQESAEHGSSFRHLLNLSLCIPAQGALLAEILLFSDAATQGRVWRLLTEQTNDEKWSDACRVLVRILAAVAQRGDAKDALTRRAADLIVLCRPLVSESWRSQMAFQCSTEDLRSVLGMFVALVKSLVDRKNRIPTHLQSKEDDIDFLPIIASLASRAFTEKADDALMQALSDRDVLAYLMVCRTSSRERVQYLLDICFPLQRCENVWAPSARGAEPVESQSSDMVVDWMYAHPSDDATSDTLIADDGIQLIAFRNPSDLRFFDRLVSNAEVNAVLIESVGTELFDECRGNMSVYVRALGEVPHLQSRSALFCKALVDAFLRKSLLQDDAQFGDLQPCSLLDLQQAREAWMTLPRSLVGLSKYQAYLLGVFSASLGFELIKAFDQWAAGRGLVLCRPRSGNASGVSILILDAIKLSTLIFRRGRRAKWSEDAMVIPEARSLLHLRSLHTSSEEGLFSSEHSLCKASMLTVLLQSLHHMPHTFPFKHRVTLFYALMEKHRHENGRAENFNPFSGRIVTIRRNGLLEDSLRALNDETHPITEPFRIRFLDADGYAEDGVDGGGLLKEWAALLAQTLLGPESSLFKPTADGSVIPNVDINPGETIFSPSDLFRLVGLLCGKALYEGILLSGTPISVLFLNRVLGLINTFDDLQFYDSLVYRNVKFVRDYEGHVADLNLNFAVTIGRKTIPLLPNGQSMSVTDDNKLQYCFLMPHHLINNAINEAATHFREGLTAAVPSSWVSLFDGFDLAKILHGVRGDLDWIDWRANTVYAAPFTEASETVRDFWEIIEESNDEFRTKVLFFVASVSRPPLLGFGALNPLFGIASSHTNVDDLPSASTCVNLLKLPDYKDKQKLRDKLEKAVSGASGFYRA